MTIQDEDYSIQRHHYSQWVYATQDMRLLSASTPGLNCMES